MPDTDLKRSGFQTLTQDKKGGYHQFCIYLSELSFSATLVIIKKKKKKCTENGIILINFKFIIQTIKDSIHLLAYQEYIAVYIHSQS